MENRYSVTKIVMRERVKAHCSIGDAFFSADVTMTCENPSLIPDYIKVGEMVKEYDGKSLILEDVACGVATSLHKMTGGSVTVKVSCDDAKHGPVEITSVVEG